MTPAQKCKCGQPTDDHDALLHVMRQPTREEMAENIKGLRGIYKRQPPSAGDWTVLSVMGHPGLARISNGEWQSGQITDTIAEALVDKRNSEVRLYKDQGKVACELFDEVKKLQQQLTTTEADTERLERSRDFYKRRCDNLQKQQSKMRDPERQWVCDILANGYVDEAIDAARKEGK